LIDRVPPFQSPVETEVPYPVTPSLLENVIVVDTTVAGISVVLNDVVIALDPLESLE
jgi:hypothetical protein